MQGLLQWTSVLRCTGTSRYGAKSRNSSWCLICWTSTVYISQSITIVTLATYRLFIMSATPLKFNPSFGILKSLSAVPKHTTYTSSRMLQNRIVKGYFSCNNVYCKHTVARSFINVEQNRRISLTRHSTEKTFRLLVSYSNKWVYRASSSEPSFFTARRSAESGYAMVSRPSVRLSVTLVYSHHIVLYFYSSRATFLT